MSCGEFYGDTVGGLLVALGFSALVFGFFSGLKDLRERDSLPLLALALGIAGIAIGAWVMRAC